jgi:uncharacterized protein YigE (DUF2233 family)
MEHSNKINSFSKAVLLFLVIGILLSISVLYACQFGDEKIIFKEINPKKEMILMNWKDAKGKPIRSLEQLINYHHQKSFKTILAMNGGMYTRDLNPQGLYIENHELLAPIDTGSGDGNFYLKPNGVFYLTKNKEAAICATEDFKFDSSINFATQSGPMLLHNGIIHHEFKKGSVNVHIRNGVGILPDKSVIFAISSTPINLYDFADFFQSKGCKEALYLDGFVSRMYLPEKNYAQIDGNFGVMISVVKPQ